MDLAVQSRGATEVNSGPQQQCLLPFVCRATQSAALHSALLSLELSGSHPVPDSAGCPQAAGLESTLAQLLALHCRAGLVQVSGASLLAALWLLQSVDSCHWSDASTCLSSWCRHLAAFSPQLVRQLTADWAASFCCLRSNLVAAQARMLGLLDWRVRLDFEAEVAPCMHMLFQASLQQAPLPHSPSPVQPPQPPHTAGLEERPVRPCTPECEEAPRRRAAPAPAAVQPAAGLLAEPTPATGPGSAARSAQQGAAAAMHAMCDAIRWQAAVIRQLQTSDPGVSAGGSLDSKATAAAPEQRQLELCSQGEPASPPIKRQRAGQH